ncbi:MAG: hypothetical protein WAO98_07230 [Alphaproteobacteria bacterium]
MGRFGRSAWDSDYRSSRGYGSYGGGYGSYSDRPSHRDVYYRPERQLSDAELAEKVYDIDMELKAERIGGRLVFTGVELQKPRDKNSPWVFQVGLDRHEATEATIAGRFMTLGVYDAPGFMRAAQNK